MNRKLLAVLGVAMLGVLALACTTETTVNQPNLESPGISVSGTGSASGTPDVAVLSVGVEAEAESVAEARSMAAEAMDAMVAALKDGGVADDDIQTTRFSVRPEYDFVLNRQELRGFVVNNMVTAKIRTIDDTGPLIDTTIEAGGDLARIENLRFTIDDPSALEDQARQEAVAEARQRAETLADAAEVDLGKARTISESGGPSSIEFRNLEAAAFAEDAAETPIELGELDIQVTVQIVYELK